MVENALSPLWDAEVGLTDGVNVLSVDSTNGMFVGLIVESDVGLVDGELVGVHVVGYIEGLFEGSVVGPIEGERVGSEEGFADGPLVGSTEGFMVGSAEGLMVGSVDGLLDGVDVG